jgi:sugar lactone lactonase YvrE
MFVVTFHGGSGGASTLYSYSDDGSGGRQYLSAATPAGPNGFRSVEFQPRQAGGSFYLVNSYKEQSQVLKLSPAGACSTFVSGVGSGASGLVSVYHPYGIAFDDALAVLYLSNQDSNVVVRVYGPETTVSGAVPGQPMPVNPALAALATDPVCLPGTFVGSQVPLAPVPTAITDAQGGLGASKGSGMTVTTPGNSVRGVAVVGNALYVADEVGNLIRRYDTGTGAYLGAVADPSSLVQSPVQLLANGGMLYATVKPGSASDALVLQYDPAQQALTAVISQSKKNLDVKHPSGMTVDGSGNFYLADLDNKVVYRFDSTFVLTAGNPFISSMPDNPEDILWVDDQWLAGG